MSKNEYALGRKDASRCSVCRHPDREGLDRSLVLKRRTQVEVARIVGVDRSTVSRHVSNHVMPTLAQGVMMDTKDVAIGNVVEAFDRTYGQTQVLYDRAMAGGDLRLAATMLDQQRRILETVVRYASKMGQATTQDIIGHDEEVERAHMKQVRSDLLERLDELQKRLTFSSMVTGYRVAACCLNMLPCRRGPLTVECDVLHGQFRDAVFV
jgi:hypothetical protein